MGALALDSESIVHHPHDIPKITTLHSIIRGLSPALILENKAADHFIFPVSPLLPLLSFRQLSVLTLVDRKVKMLTSRQPVWTIPSQVTSPPNGGRSNGRVRLDPYTKMLHRFYEPHLITCALGQVRGGRTTTISDASDSRFIRRQFLRDLAFICQYKKDGDTVTAIGVEDRPEHFVYWVAANKDASPRIVPFLRNSLVQLKDIASSGTDQSRLTDEFVKRCMEEARARILAETNMLKGRIRECQLALRRYGEHQGNDLSEWLQLFAEETDYIDICRLAWRERQSSKMRKLEELGRDHLNHSAEGDRKSPFAEAKHYIGRLQAHVHIPQRLVRAAQDASTPDVQALLDTFKVLAVPKMAPAPRPDPDRQTKLDSIAKRLMIARPSYSLEATKAALADLDRAIQFQDRIMALYERALNLRVHAEIQVLEHFHSQSLRWAFNDRYIGCGKPACFNCLLYIRHHEARCEEPDSHQKVYLNWGLPALPGRAMDTNFWKQNILVSKMRETMVDSALEQIMERRPGLQYHADSTTGITTIFADLDPIGALTGGLESVHLSGIQEEG